MPNNIGVMQIVLTSNNANFSQGIAEAQRRLDALAGTAKNAGHSTVSSMQASSAALRELNGDITNNIRAVERFITTIPGAGKALQAIFPLVGGIAFGAMLVEVGTKLAEVIKKANEMPKAIHQAFASLHVSSVLATDSLRLTNDELQDSINKLQGKAQNNLAIQLDEARIKADELAKSLENDAQKIKAILEQNKVGGWAALIGKAGTANVSGSIKSFNDDLTDLGTRRADALGKGDKAGAAKLLQQIHDKQNAALDWSKHKLFYLDNPQFATDEDRVGMVDQSANRNIVLGFQSTIRDSQDSQVQKDRNASLVPQEKSLQAGNSAAEERLRAMQVQLNELKQQQALTVKSEYAYWQARVNAFAQGSAQYKEVQDKLTDLAKAGANKAAEVIKQFTDARRRASGDGVDGGEIVARANESFQREAVKKGGDQDQDYVNSNESAITNAQSQAREREARITDQAGKSMTRYAAAVELAKVHAQEFAVVMESLQGILNTRLQRYALDPSKENAKAVAEAQASVVNANTQHAIQAQGDSDAINGRATSGLVGFADSLDDFVNASRDTAAQMRDLGNNILEGFNRQLLAGLSGQKTNFHNYGASVFRGVAGVGLDKVEGIGLGALGFGGQVGSRTNPMWTRSADGAGVAVGGVAGSLLHSMFGWGGQKGPGAAGLATALSISSKAGGIGPIASSLIDLIPHFATGGPISANTMAMVGENGPELFVPHMGGAIIPNHKLTSGSGHTFYIDASDSTDPAQTEAAVRRGIAAATPHIQAGAIKFFHESRLRRPTTAR